CMEEGDLAGRAEILAAVGSAYADRYEWNEALSSYFGSLTLFERLGDIYGHAQTAFNIALIYKDKGDWSRALEMLERSQEIFMQLGAAPCIAMVKMNQGVIQSALGQYGKAEESLSGSVGIFENMGAMPDLTEAYIAMARFKLKADLPVEARFYLSEADALVHKINYDPIRITLFSAWGEFYQGERLYSDASRNYQLALALSRKLCNPHEEARALRNLGCVALLQKDYRECAALLHQALEIFNRLEAMYDVMSLYYNMASLALAQEEYARAEEISILLERQGGLLGYVDLNIRALVAIADCEMHTGRKEEARRDYARALELAKGHGGATYSKTLSLLMGKVIECLEEAAPANGDDILELEALKRKLQKKDYKGLLENLPAALDTCRD
ncbi:MAG TPA: tetratricopeptide repeat protein, partial [Methanotrichaceae archaeon]|nr:tetratricopeptide repeat protein [Methanotrichaceae archaeon]